MVLEECPITKTVNKFWNEKILDSFPVLSNSSNAKYLSLKEYIIQTVVLHAKQKPGAVIVYIKLILWNY